MTTMSVFLRTSIKPGHFPGSLYVRLIHQRRVKSLTLPDCSLYPEEWDKTTQTVLYPDEDSSRSEFLRNVERRIHEEISVINGYIRYLEHQGRYSVDEVVRLYRQRQDNSKIMGYTECLATELERRGQERTARAYRTVCRGLVLFNKGNDIPLEHINSSLIKDFELYLKGRGKLPNTISYYMRNLRAIYNKALSNQRISFTQDKNPFSGVYTGVTKTRKRSLSLEEMKKIHNLDLIAMIPEKSNDLSRYTYLQNLYASQRYFSFCFYARGMCFIDLAYLRKENIRGGFIRYIRKKTGQQMEVRIIPQMQSIIESFSDQVKGSPYLFPIIRNENKKSRLQYETALRSQNQRLKELAKMAGVNKAVSTHWARHSWTTIGKQENLPLRVISECLGHTSEKTTLIYLGSLENSVLDAANETIALALTTVSAVL
ncbi:MAG: site-specific integrase [Bacteroidales bacterium]|nr:site-specific integrase [Bacteroidales bacterium]